MTMKSALISTAVLLGGLLASSAATADEATLSQEQAKALKAPAPFTAESVRKGRAFYQMQCAICHGGDGKAQVDTMANAADLTQPDTWKLGASDGETFRSITDGAGKAMPPFRTTLTPQQRWDIVAYVKSLQAPQ